MSAARRRPLRPPPALVSRVMRRLAREIDGMDIPAVEKISSEHAEDPFRVLIGTLLSARTQDQTTHAASTRLFQAAPTPEAMAALPVKRLEKLIYPVGFYRNKAKFVKAAAAAIVDRFGGHVPASLDEMVTLPGVGRKTANLVMIIAFQSADHICVDTHVHRISNRLGWVSTADPEETEQALYAAVERRWWALLNRYLVTWGQNVCRPVYPRCGACAINPDCPQIGVERVGRI